MAHYERWLIPLLDTGSIEFYQSNQDWTRMNKVEKIGSFAPCYDYLQVCLTQSGNCGLCMKCKRTLMELDALGDEVLDRFGNSFDIQHYRRESRAKWFGSIMTDKEKSNDEATYLDEAFVCAAAHHPELLRGLSPEKRSGVRTARLLYDGVNVRPLPAHGPPFCSPPKRTIPLPIPVNIPTGSASGRRMEGQRLYSRST